MKLQIPATGLLIVSALSAAPVEDAVSATGPCPVSGMKPCVLTLEGPGAPGASGPCLTEPWSKLLRFTRPERWSDSDGNGAWETVVEIRLDPSKNCGCARLRLFYGEKVSGWTVHVGDSPTNDGHGGDQGTTSSAAEVHVLDGLLTVYTAAQSVRRQVDKLLEVAVPPLAGRTLDLEVCDQSLGVGILPTSRDPHPPKWRLETQTSKLLFSLASGEENGPNETGGSIYAGFNRVVHLKTGAPSRGRVGRGVRRVEIALIP